MTPALGGTQSQRDLALIALVDGAAAAAAAVVEITSGVKEVRRGTEPLDAIVQAHAQLDRSVEALHRAKRFSLHGFPTGG